MEKQTENGVFLENELTRRGYRPRTVEAYKYWIDQLYKYFPDIAAETFTFEHVKEFIDYLINRKKAKPNTVHQAAHSIIVVFNEVYKKDFDFDLLEMPQRPTEVADVLSKDEIILLLNNSEELYRLVFATMYSSGLTLDELRNLRLTDINFTHRQLSIFRSQGKRSRKSILSEYLATELQSYLRNKRPQKWIFEGETLGIQISGSAIQRAFKRAILKASIKKKVTPRILKYSYVKHLYSDGIPLESILKTLGMSSRYQSRTYYFYAAFCVEDVEVKFSPLSKTL